MYLALCFTEAILLRDKNATEAEVEQIMKVWLRGAPDRNGGRKERARKNADENHVES